GHRAPCTDLGGQIADRCPPRSAHFPRSVAVRGQRGQQGQSERRQALTRQNRVPTIFVAAYLPLNSDQASAALRTLAGVLGDLRGAGRTAASAFSATASR